jgi:hypothetical protein
MEIRDPENKLIPGPDPGVKKATDPGSGSATHIVLCLMHVSVLSLTIFSFEVLITKWPKDVTLFVIKPPHRLRVPSYNICEKKYSENQKSLGKSRILLLRGTRTIN